MIAIDQDPLTVGLAIAGAGLAGFLLGRRRDVFARFRRFQNPGELQVARILTSRFTTPDFHLLNHVTLPLENGTTQIDHILVSRYGIFVIETKHLRGWVFGTSSDAKWTKVYFRRKISFQNPLRQNYRHLCAVRTLLDFLPASAVKSVVVVCGEVEFKTKRPESVLFPDELTEYISQHTEAVVSPNRMQFCVGRLETARLAMTRQTDVEHIEQLARRFGTHA